MKNGTKVIQLRTAETIDHEAADWLTKLDSGRFSKAERNALRDWLKQDAAHATALRSLASIWSDMDLMLNECLEPEYAQRANIFSVFSSLNWAQAAFTLFGLSIISVLIALLYLDLGLDSSPKVEVAFYATDIGDQRIESLEDGSIAHLNTDSMIETEFTESMRIIRLLKGEALFDVTHDPDRPFVVYAGDRRVQAIGTRFVVRLTSENIVVTVTEGQVELSRRDEESGPLMAQSIGASAAQEVILIREGETVVAEERADAPEPETMEAGEIDRHLSWASGQLVFQNERLEQVIEEVGRYVPGSIVIDDPELADVRVNGRFQIGDTDALLEAIEVSLSITAIRDDEVIRLAR